MADSIPFKIQFKCKS